MENFGFRGLLVTLYQRVVLSYRTTLLGMGIVAAGAVADYLGHAPSKTVATIGAIVAGVLALVKEKYPAPPAEP